MIPDLNRLKVFYYVFTHLSVALAAKELNISSSAVSQSLAKLENELKTALFTRLHRKLVPTIAGEQLFKITAPFVRDLQTGVANILKAKKTPSGLIRLGAPIEFGKHYFPSVFAAFRYDYPDVTFCLKLGNSNTILSMLRSGDIDFGLVDILFTGDSNSPDFDIFAIEPLIDEQLSLTCSKAYYDEFIEKDHSYQNLVIRNFISYQDNSLPLRQWFRHHFNRYSPKLNRVVTVDSHQAVINCIMLDMGLGVLSRHIVAQEIKRKLIVPITTGKTDIINKISLAQRQSKVPSLTEKTFIRFLTRDIRESGMAAEFGPPSKEG